ncbi:hypothetical protein ACN38_g2151 [Penicillium nordicum]|uniref:Uncharacterized protein n=1 Tax=Penicillium nordicum TaxID=229535 RepID=A0A0M9WJ75_9EURO|nr:hypothetical protein ACN38_g2151 [Penicillium nordicum]
MLVGYILFQSIFASQNLIGEYKNNKKTMTTRNWIQQGVCSLTFWTASRREPSIALRGPREYSRVRNGRNAKSRSRGHLLTHHF